VLESSCLTILFIDVQALWGTAATTIPRVQRPCSPKFLASRS
jgi:hypothetical protein